MGYNTSSYVITRMFALALVAGLSGCANTPPAVPGPAEVANGHQAEIAAWQERREAGLKRESGWLSLVGLHWLQPGENSIGTDPTNDLVFTYGPEFWGTVVLNDQEVVFKAAAAGTLINGEPGTESILLADTTGEPTVIANSTTNFYVIERGSYALRVKDSQAPGRVNFSGLDFFPTNEQWRVEAEFRPAKEGETILIGNVLDTVSDEPVYGTAVFHREGREHRLVALGESGDSSLFFIFSDKTNNRETYGAGRFMYTNLPQDGVVVLDFNKAYNPPCAFNDYSTCPLPPPENRLALRVTAGEKKYAFSSDQ